MCMCSVFCSGDSALRERHVTPPTFPTRRSADRVGGPAIGGLRGEIGPRAPFVAAALLAAANMIDGALIFPETLPPERRRAFDWRRANPLGAWQAMRALPGMGGVALVLLLWQVDRKCTRLHSSH